MGEITVKGTVARVEYRTRRLRVLHILQDDGRTLQVQLSYKMNDTLPNNIVGAEVTGTAIESWTPGVHITNYLGFVEPDVQPLLAVERPIVIFDSHEAATNPELIAQMRNFNFDVAVSPLTGTGADLVASSRVGIQLKMSLDDLYASVSDGRMFSEIDELESSYELPMILAVGSEPERNHANPASVQGALAYLMLSVDRLHIYRCMNRMEAALFIKSLVKQEQLEQHRYPTLKQWRRQQGRDAAKLALVSQLPGVGARTATEVLRARKTVEATTQMHEIDWRKYVPRKRAQEIEKVLREPYPQP